MDHASCSTALIGYQLSTESPPLLIERELRDNDIPRPVSRDHKRSPTFIASARRVFFAPFRFVQNLITTPLKLTHPRPRFPRVSACHIGFSGLRIE